MRSWRPSAVHRTLVAALAAILVMPLVWSSAGPVSAAPAVSTPTIRSKQAEAVRAEERLSDLADLAEQRYQDYLSVTGQLDKTRAEIAVNERDLEAATAALVEARARLGSRADSIYRTGPAATLEVLMGTQSITDFLSRVDLMAAIGRSDAELVTEVRDARFKVEQARTALDVRESELSALRIQAAQRKADVDSAFKQQRDYLTSIRGEIARLVKAEQARQAKLAAERARRARIAALARARAAAAASAARKRSGAGSRGSRTAPSASPSQIAQIALEYLGVPYVWGGTSPAGFDCSGLAQYVYARCGVSIPRTSRDQFASGTRIPAGRLDLLKAGDLVFFGTSGDPSRVHHVGIYCGDGDFVHAPATGETVRVSSLTARIADHHDYVGGSRY